jgi:thiol-disulfide isomerase/thioredoxin
MLCSSSLKKRITRLLALVVCTLFLALMSITAPASSDAEYHGKLEAELAPNIEDLDQVVFRPVRDLSKIKFAKAPDPSDKATVGRLFHPLLDKNAILAVLVEPEDGTPFLYADADMDGSLSEDERFELTRGEDDNPYILQATLKLPLKGKIFADFPVFVQFLKNVQWDEMKEGERLVLQSKAALAKGYVDIAGHKTLVEYNFNPQTKRINTTHGWLGVDGDGDDQIDIDRFSSEAADAQDETVVFRVGDHYVSTKHVDLDKNEITLREHPASAYKRVELAVGGEVPDFNFTDFGGKKRKLSEFRGKYLLLDFWAAWCGPCRRELPYQRAAYSRFQARGFEILGMNNDEDPSQVRGWLKANRLTWAQATRDSIRDVEIRYRIHLFPTELLIGPDGKVISLDQSKKKQPSLRGADLIKTLDEILPP